MTLPFIGGHQPRSLKLHAQEELGLALLLPHIDFHLFIQYTEAVVCQDLGLERFLPQGTFLRENESQREEVTFPRSRCELLQSPSRTLDSLSSALTSNCPGCSGHLLGGRSQLVPVPECSLLSESMSASLPGKGQGLYPAQGSRN